MRSYNPWQTQLSSQSTITTKLFMDSRQHHTTGFDKRSKKSIYIHELEGLRGISAIGIMLTHIAFQTGWASGGIIERMIGRLDYFLAVFFALSAFLLWRRYGSFNTTPKWRDYLIKRLGRIMPVYWVFVILSMLFLPNTKIQIDNPMTVFGTLTLTQGIAYHAAMLHGFGHLWSLSVEMTFYLLLPLLVMLALKLGKHSITIAGLLACGSLALAWLPSLLVINDYLIVQVRLILPTFTTWFLLGIGTAILEQRWQRQPPTKAIVYLLAQRWLYPLLACAVLHLAALPSVLPEGYVSYTPAQQASKIILGALFALLLILPPALRPVLGIKPCPWLCTPLMQFLGKISYSWFLWHMAILQWVFLATGIAEFSRTVPDLLIVLGLTSSITLPVAYISWRFIEQPASRFFHHYCDKRRRIKQPYPANYRC